MLIQRSLSHIACLLFLSMFSVGFTSCDTQSNNTLTQSNKNTVTSATPPQSPQREPANPRRLLIPIIGVNALIEEVGITSTGELATPKQKPWVDTGWYKGGPRPGDNGSSVIDGHLDRPGGSPAVFWKLRDLHIGNEIDVVDKSGQTQRFHVTDIEYYKPQNAPLQAIFGNNSGKYLNLITCAGDWIPIQHQTTLRLVVYSRSI